jgi:hypothetical protein
LQLTLTEGATDVSIRIERMMALALQ